jgi:hypothetical protein
MQSADVGPSVCVLGMHRSGTSLTAKAIELLGIDLGPESTMLAPVETDNPKGYWEQQAIRSLNDELLAVAGGDWARPPALEPGWERAPELDALRQRAQTTLETHYPQDRMWAWKDPRACLTLPFWRTVVDPVAYVICVRDPLEVAASLHRRDPVAHPDADSIALWLRHNSDALRHTTGVKRLFLRFEDWFDAPDRQMTRLARFLDADEPSAKVMARVHSFVEHELRHHRVEELRADVPLEARVMHVLLLELAGEAATARPAFEEIATELWDAYDHRRREMRRLAEQLDDCGAELRRTHATLASVLDTSSWRLTAPLRAARRHLRRARRRRARA